MKNNLDKLEVDKLVPVPVDLSRLSNVVKNDAVKKDVYNAKIKNIEDKIPDITNLATTATLTMELLLLFLMENKYLTMSYYNMRTNNILDTKITQKKLVNESDLIKKIKILATKEEIKTLATKTKLKAEQDKMVKLQTYDLSLFIGPS